MWPKAGGRMCPCGWKCVCVYESSGCNWLKECLIVEMSCLGMSAEWIPPHTTDNESGRSQGRSLCVWLAACVDRFDALHFIKSLTSLKHKVSHTSSAGQATHTHTRTFTGLETQRSWYKQLFDKRSVHGRGEESFVTGLKNDFNVYLWWFWHLQTHTFMFSSLSLHPDLQWWPLTPLHRWLRHPAQQLDAVR